MLKKTFHLFNLLSLNVVFGAVISSTMFWKLPDGNGQIEVPTLILLGLTTWIIYILDRLLDLRIYPQNPSVRHRFHSDNQYNISILLVVIIIIAGVLCFFIPREVFVFGCILSAGLAAYFFVLNKVLKNKRMQWIKEPTTAIFYSLAVIGIAYVYHPSINLSAWALAFLFFLVVSQNLLIFSFFETKASIDSSNTVDFFGQKASLRLIRLIGFVVLFCAIFLFSSGWEYANMVGLTLAIMSQILSFLPAKESFFLKNERYRWVGDGVFLLPILLLLL